jgi:menaquinone-dependent protoporphyrinogen oxidase
MNTTQRRLRVLVTAASGHGSTTEIARAIGHALDNDHIAVDIVAPELVDSIEDYDAVVLGSAVYAGHWLASANDFAVRFRHPLAARCVWLFSSGPLGDSGRGHVQSMEQDPADVVRIRRDLSVRSHRTFPGKLSPQTLSLMQRASVLVAHRASGDFRDWDAITEWAASIAADLADLAPR